VSDVLSTKIQVSDGKSGVAVKVILGIYDTVREKSNLNSFNFHFGLIEREVSLHYRNGQNH
jgi:hypothetical protein